MENGYSKKEKELIKEYINEGFPPELISKRIKDIVDGEFP